MLTNNRTRGFIALLVLLAIAFTTAPITAADFTTKLVIGSVSAVGSVNLRGVTISQEGTLFPGDQVSVGAKGYAKVTLLNGHKLELASMTKLTVVGSKQSAQLQVASGNMGFTTQAGTLDIVAGNYQITGDHNVVGNVAYVGNGFVGLHVKIGTVTVRNMTTKETVKVNAGQDRLFSLQGDMNRPLAQLASNGLPAPIPTVPPAPDPQAGGGNPPAQANGITKTGWVAILGTIGGAAAAIAVLATRPNNTVNNSLILTQQKTIAAATAAQATAVAATTTATQVASTATAATVAIAAATNLPTATRTTLTTQAQTLSAAAQASQQQIGQLQIQLQQLQTQLSNASGPQITAIQNQINTVTNSLNSEVTNLDNEINALNALVASAVASGVPNTPSVPVTIQPIPPAPTASASIPG